MTPICSPPNHGSFIVRALQPNRQIVTANLARMSSDMSLCATQRQGS
jgi:hypothetical protein